MILDGDLVRRRRVELRRSVRQLADYQRLFGDWRELFRSIDRIEAVTAEDVRRVAAETLVETNRTVAQIVTRPPAPAPAAPGADEEAGR